MKMPALIPVTVVLASALLLAGCGGGGASVQQSNTTMGQELMDLEASYKQGIITERDYLTIYSEQLSIPLIDLTDVEIDSDLLRQTPSKVVHRDRVVPIDRHNGTIRVATKARPASGSKRVRLRSNHAPSGTHREPGDPRP